jgi:hypothetical protein
MNAALKQAKQQIRPYLQQISETALTALYCMAQDGRVSFTLPCKCIRGVVGGGTVAGYRRENGEDALKAEGGLNKIGIYGHDYSDSDVHDRYRNIRLLPMVRYELRRRDRRAQASHAELVSILKENPACLDPCTTETIRAISMMEAR